MKNMTSWFLLIVLIGSCSNKTEYSGNTDKSPPEEVKVADAIPIQAQTEVRPPPPPPPPVPPPPPAPPPKPTTKLRVSIIDIAFSTKKLDIVWVIDNSASMGEEIEQVRRNLLQFNTKLAKLNSVKMAVIVANTGTPSLVVPPEVLAQGHIQIPVSVNSNDAMAIAAAASCKPSVVDGTVCGQAVDQPGGAANAAASLLSFFRPGAARMYVFVTDDDAAGVTDANFLNLIRSENPALKPYVYAFRGIVSQPNCNIAAPGLAYDNLAKATDSKTYDICTADWNVHFQDLTAAVDQIAAVVYDLPPTTLRVASVKIDGIDVPPSNYKVENNKITFNDSVISAKSLKVEVTIEEAITQKIDIES